VLEDEQAPVCTFDGKKVINRDAAGETATTAGEAFRRDDNLQSSITRPSFRDCLEWWNQRC